jgi:hypothetical protein
MVKMCAHIARVLLGLIFVVSVIVRVLMPQVVASAGFPVAAQAWLDAMRATGYLQPLLYLTEFIGGGALLLNIFVPAALITLTPIVLNIALFHFFLDLRPARIVLVLFVLAAHLLLIYLHRRSLMPLIEKVDPIWSGLKVGRFDLRSLLQILLGLTLVVTGGAKLLIPDRLSVGDLLIDGMKATGYLYPLLGATEFVTGLLLATNNFVPLTLVVLAPIMLNIFFYHLFLATVGLPVFSILSGIYIAIVIAHFHAYRPLLNFRN